MDIYREEILEHYRNPHNFRVLPGADLSVEEANPLCGDSLKLFLKLAGKGKDKIVTEVSFLGVGCVLSTVSASMLTDLIKGKTLKEIKALKKEDLLGLIGAEVAPARLKCALLPLEAVRKVFDSKD